MNNVLRNYSWGVRGSARALGAAFDCRLCNGRHAAPAWIRHVCARAPD
jgi:hypothetical protein